MTITPDDIRTIRSASGVATLYHHLGYEADLEPEGYSPEEAFLTGAAAHGVSNVYLLVNLNDDLQHVHVETSNLSSYRLRQLAENFVRRPGSYLLSASTKTYDKIVFIKPSQAQGKTKLSKLTVHPAQPTAHDASILRAIAAKAAQTAPSLHALQVQAFDVERVTKAFYLIYHDLFHRVAETVKELNPSTRIGPLIRNTTDDLNSLHAFTQRLLSRVMFLYFVQKKGWLDGKSDYLPGLYRTSVSNDVNFYRDVLERLFFTMLNSTERPQEASIFGKVPYLNGSLFEREYPPETRLELPNSLFDPRQDGSILNVFNSYNFTINESSSLDQEVSLDPEMLGKVFENMMEAEEAARNGTFYTPRSIVQFLAEEAISRYLSDKTGIERERLMNLLGEDDSYGDISIAEANKIIEALSEVRVLDPAVGTASMLVGTLNVLVGIRRSAEARLGVKVKEESPRFSEWKREYINHCLYGVDIKQEAIEIGRLRLWLSLVVDAQEPEPLPNLDYKLMAGDGLLESIEGTPFINVQQGVVGHLGEIRQLTYDIEELHTGFFAEQDPTKRNEYRKSIQQRERELFRVDIDQRIANTKFLLQEIDKRGKVYKGDDKKSQTLLENFNRLCALRRKVWDEQEPLPFFLHNVHFSEVMKGKGGFDIVLGNPPYVSIANLTPAYKLALRKAFPQVQNGRADLYVYFFEKALHLLSANGYVAYITPNKFLQRDYGEPLRDLLKQTTTVTTLVDFGDLPVFDATTYPFITIIKKASPTTNQIVQIIPEASIKKLISPALKAGPQAIRSALSNFHNFAKSLFQALPQKSLSDEGWSLESDEVFSLLSKIADGNRTLSQIVDNRIHMGIITGKNSVFVISEKKKDMLLNEDSESEQVIKPFYRGRDIKKWQVAFADQYLIFTKRGFAKERYPAVSSYLDSHQSTLSNRTTVKARAHPWYELQQPQEGINKYFDEPHIAWKETSAQQAFSLVPKGLYANNKCFFVPSDDLVLLAILNSELCWFFLKKTTPQVQGGALALQAKFLGRFPIPEIPEDRRKEIEALVKEVLRTSRQDQISDIQAGIEAHLEKYVCELYGVSEDEILLIQSSNYVDPSLLTVTDEEED